jgi:hypothetical protein
MTDVLAILAELLGIMAALIILGEPLRMGFSRIDDFFKTSNLVEACILNVYLGGLILYVLALLPLHLFSTIVIASLLLISGMLSVIGFLKSKMRKRGATIRAEDHRRRRTNTFEYIFVLGLFCVALYIQILPLTSLVYGSIHDTSYHSLLTEVIIESRGVPITLEPYLPEGIIYPQAAHVIFAFAANLTGWVVPQSVFYVTPLFSALTVLAVYFMARRLWPNRAFYLGAVFIFTFVASWPMFVTWGANPFIVGLPLFLICSALSFSLFFDSDKRAKWGLCLIGVLFGYLGAIMISFLQTLLAISVISLLINLFLRHSDVRQKVKNYVVLFAVSLIPLGPFLFRFVLYYPNVGHNIGLPADFIGYPRVQNQMGQGLQWAFKNLSPYPLLRMGTITLCALSVLLLLGVKRERGQERVFLAALLIFLAGISLSLLSEVLPPDVSVVSSTHQVIIMIVSLYLLVALFGRNLFAFLRSAFSKFTRIDVDGFRVAFLVSILVLSMVFAPFVMARLCSDPSTLRGAYGVFAVTGNDDNELMLWIRENLSREAVILVNQYEPGLFIPAVSNRKAIFATPGSQLSRSYQKLCGLLSNGTLNATCYSIMSSFGITHVYVGSVATYWWVKAYRWDPQLFLNSPNFRLIKRIGGAYLFQVSYENT